jgi:hypothetical protein
VAPAVILPVLPLVPANIPTRKGPLILPNSGVVAEYEALPPIANPVTTLAPPDKTVVGTADTEKDVELINDETTVPEAKAPVPAVTLMGIPRVSPVVLPTVIIDPEEVAPAAET